MSVEVAPSSAGAPKHPQETSDIINQLDDLYERYLVLLDQQQSLQKTLAAKLKTGFFSIAEANFTAPSRVRYGQDFYDGRMQATARVAVRSQSGDSQGPFAVRIIRSPPAKGVSNGEQAAEKQEGHGHPPLHDEEATDQPARTEKPDQPARTEEPDQPARTEKPDQPARIEKPDRSRDPLRWFGILVPPPLRSAQTDFSSVVTDVVPRLVEVQEEMRGIEEEISSLNRSRGGR